MGRTRWNGAPARMQLMNSASDEIDLGRYSTALLRHLRLIVGAAVVAAVLAGVATMVVSAVAPKYRSDATVLLTGARYRVQLDPRFTSVDSLQGTQGVQGVPLLT